MKEKMKHFFGEAMGWLSMAVGIVVYGVAGNLLMYPYTFLIGWDNGFPPLNAAFFGIIFLPAATISLCVLYHIGKNQRQRLRRAELQDTAEAAYRLFWWTLGLLLLPILTNGLSLLLKVAGLPVVGNFIYEWRYASFFAIPASMAFGYYRFIDNIRRKCATQNRPPANDAPPRYRQPTHLMA